MGKQHFLGQSEVSHCGKLRERRSDGEGSAFPHLSTLACWSATSPVCRKQELLKEQNQVGQYICKCYASGNK